MTEEEALIRAREAVIDAAPTLTERDARLCRLGEYDAWLEIQAAKRALLDRDKPLPVDRDLADLDELLASIGLEDWKKTKRAMLPTFRAIIQRRLEEGK